MKRIISTTLSAGALLALSALAGSLHAGVIYLDSTPSGLLSTVAITPHSLWQGNNPTNPGDPTDNSAVWISYALTGVAPDNVLQTPGTSHTFWRSFTSGAGFLNLKVWADDTAGVSLDGNLLMPPIFSQSICSGAIIGCRPGDAFVIDNAVLTAGNHTLRFDVYQVGTGTDNNSNPFGLLYTGTATATPEPATLFLAGGVLLTLGLVRKRRPVKS